MDGYGKFWMMIIDVLFNDVMARGLAYGLLIMGLYILIGRKQVTLGSMAMGLSATIAFGSTLLNAGG